MMAPKIVASLALSLVLIGVLYAVERPAKGVIFFKEFDFRSIDTAEVVEYSDLDAFGGFYIVTDRNGTERRIASGLLVGNIPYPSSTASATSKAVIDKIDDLMAKLPRHRAVLREAKAKWIDMQSHAPRPIASPARTRTGLTLVAIGGKYEDAKLIRVEGESVVMSHSVGLVTIPLSQLSKDQIVALNGTNTAVQIDLDWKERARRLREAETEARAVEEKRIARQKMEIEQRRIADLSQKGHQREEAEKLDEALELFIQAGATDDVHRVAHRMASDFESKGDLESAADYFETAGEYSEAGRVRKRISPESESSVRLSDADIFNRSKDAVVMVHVTSQDDDAHGSGFFVANAGYLLTNHHVIQGSTSIEIKTSDGRTHRAQLVASTKAPDLALLKADVPNNKFLKLGNSDKVKTGDHVLAIGYPVLQELSATMNQGVISSTDRTFRGNSVFQIDATINHGNSGGPLLNNRGQVVGITTFGLADLGVDRFNFAIRINEARNLLSHVGTH